MEHSTSWEANSHSASQKLPALYGTWRFITMFASLSLVPVLSQMNPIHTSPPYFSKIHSDTVLPSPLDFFVSPPVWGLGKGVRTHHKNQLVTKCYTGPQTWTDSLEWLQWRKMDMSLECGMFGVSIGQVHWKKEQVNWQYMLDLVEVERVRWGNVAVNQQTVTFFLWKWEF
jgi:hypothetical protein